MKSTNPVAAKIDQLQQVAAQALAHAVDSLKLDDEALDRVLDRIEELTADIVEEIGKLAKPKPKFLNDRTKDGWELVEDVGLTPAITSPTQLELVSFLKEGESYVNGEVMAKRAIELKAAMGQNHAEWLLAHQSEIPKEFRKYYLVFTGTIWRGSDGRRYVPYLYWYDNGWYLGFNCLGIIGWSGGSRRLLRLRE